MQGRVLVFKEIYSPHPPQVVMRGHNYVVISILKPLKEDVYDFGGLSRNGQIVCPFEEAS